MAAALHRTHGLSVLLLPRAVSIPPGNAAQRWAAAGSCFQPSLAKGGGLKFAWE